MTQHDWTMADGFVPVPEQFAARYRDRGYWTGESLGDILKPWVRKTPEAPALMTIEGRSMSFAALEAAVESRASGLAASGLRHGDVVVLQLPNSMALVITLLALFHVGAKPVLALPPHRHSDIAYLVNAASARHYICCDWFQGFDYRTIARSLGGVRVLVDGDASEFERLDRHDDSEAKVTPGRGNQIAFFLLSGGTTGRPKLIPRTHDDYGYQIRATANAMRFGEGDTYLAALSMAHNAALGCPGMLGALAAGGCVAMISSPAPDLAFDIWSRAKPKLTTLMPQILALWAEAASAYGTKMVGLTVEVGGARLDPSIFDAVRNDLGCNVSHWFGMSEGFHAFTRPDDPPDRARHSQGRPLSADDEWRIVDASGFEVEDGQPGELLVRGPTTIRGYFAAPEENARAFTPDGFLRTKDIARINRHGDLEVLGRLDARINRAGEKISPDEVEEHIMLHSDVKDVCVLALPDPLLGERTLAVLATYGETILNRATLATFLTEIGLARFKHPDQVAVLSELPRTRIGKTDRDALRRQFDQDGAV
jgi:2,3-dihydroxybenzoate-AMP ligase